MPSPSPAFTAPVRVTLLRQVALHMLESVMLRETPRSPPAFADDDVAFMLYMAMVMGRVLENLSSS